MHNRLFHARTPVKSWDIDDTVAMIVEDQIQHNSQGLPIWSPEELYERIPCVPPAECELFFQPTQAQRDTWRFPGKSEGSFKIVPAHLRALPEVPWEALFLMAKPIDPATGKQKGNKVPQQATELMVNLLAPQNDMQVIQE